ncbi:glutamate ABC transporter substrate-binding protein [Propioniciclava soli]|uniref:Glutamate ABC transporter substrate-binding protein n=1 Tax=Propioniciclava soli TaxID=2775081 RepID=A0ABZ3CAM3_9ACTN|nr:glutamate ABC transporter substrate-binding protein [Propioniciclava soli]
MTRSTTWALAASAAAFALTLSACGGSAAAPGTDTTAGGDAAPSGPIRIGIKYDQPGLGLQEGTNFTGFDVEVATYVAGELGYPEDQIEFIQAPSPQRETMLEGDQVDLIFATYSITDTRKERISFAGPYFIAGQDLLVRADDTSITGPETLTGKRLCSVAGSTPAENVKKEHPDVELIEYDTYSLCVSALDSGAVDALTTDNVILAGYAAQPQWEGKFRVVGNPFSTERYGVGVPKGETERCEAVNAALEKMIEDGAWQTALDETVGRSGFEPDDRNPPSVDEDCA